jgi:hypothetical protein
VNQTENMNLVFSHMAALMGMDEGESNDFVANMTRVAAESGPGIALACDAVVNLTEEDLAAQDAMADEVSENL